MPLSPKPPNFYFTASGKYAYFRGVPLLPPNPCFAFWHHICKNLVPKFVSIAFSLRPEESLLVWTLWKLVWIISLIFQFYFAMWINYTTTLRCFKLSSSVGLHTNTSSMWKKQKSLNLLKSLCISVVKLNWTLGYIKRHFKTQTFQK